MFIDWIGMRIKKERKNKKYGDRLQVQGQGSGGAEVVE